MKSAMVYSREYLKHIPLPGDEPESPSRLQAIMRKIDSCPISDRLERIEAGPRIDTMEALRMVHSQSHIEKVESMASNYNVCKLAVEGALTAADAILSGKVRNAFCALRPPGHHASRDGGPFGFCYFNNAAVSARYLQKKGLRRILIADWDYHHGNGTEDIFYDDPDVLYFSCHQLDAFPWTGFEHRKGSGAGIGANINVPMPEGAGDSEFISAFNKILLPAADSFKPDFLIISAGFDSRSGDLLGKFSLSDQGFFQLSKIAMKIAEEHCDSRILSVLEGGYNFKGLASAVESHLNALTSRIATAKPVPDSSLRQRLQ